MTIYELLELMESKKGRKLDKVRRKQEEKRKKRVDLRNISAILGKSIVKRKGNILRIFSKDGMKNLNELRSIFGKLITTKEASTFKTELRELISKPVDKSALKAYFGKFIFEYYKKSQHGTINNKNDQDDFEKVLNLSKSEFDKTVAKIYQSLEKEYNSKARELKISTKFRDLIVQSRFLDHMHVIRNELEGKKI